MILIVYARHFFVHLLVGVPPFVGFLVTFEMRVSEFLSEHAVRLSFFMVEAKKIDTLSGKKRKW